MCRYNYAILGSVTNGGMLFLYSKQKVENYEKRNRIFVKKR